MRRGVRVVLAAVCASILSTSARRARADEEVQASPMAPPPVPAPVTGHDEANALPAHGGAPAQASPRGDTHPAVAGDVAGIEIGARFGYAAPFGENLIAATETPTGTIHQGNLISGGLPLTFDAGYRVIPSVYVGAFFTYSFLLMNSDALEPFACNAGLRCSGHQIDLGADVQFHVKPDGLVHPWIGLGFGYQWTAVDLSNAQSGSAVFSGFEFVNLQLGLDLKAATRVGLGPFVTFSLGKYDHVSTSFGGQTTSTDLENSALHEWLTFGVRAVYDFAR
jgi:hypothetical protein